MGFVPPLALALPADHSRQHFTPITVYCGAFGVAPHSELLASRGMPSHCECNSRGMA